MKGAGGTTGGLGIFFAGAAMVVAGGYLLLTLLVGIGRLFFNAKSMAGWLLAAAGALIIFVGIIANLRMYFQPSSLFDTLLILTLIAGGIGLVARSLKEPPQ